MATQRNLSHRETQSTTRRERGVRRLLVRIGLLAVCVVVTGVALGQYDTTAGDDNYLAAVLEKDRIIRNASSPKVILVGGSNLAFGIDSKMMQDSLGMSVVNMGLSWFPSTISSTAISQTATTR
jgi:hypothetical protein